MPPGFPTVPHYLNPTPVVPGPSQNRTWCVTPSGSQFVAPGSEISWKSGDVVDGVDKRHAENRFVVNLAWRVDRVLPVVRLKFVFSVCRLVSRRCHTISTLRRSFPVPRRTGLGALHHPAPSSGHPRRHGVEVVDNPRSRQHTVENRDRTQKSGDVGNQGTLLTELTNGMQKIGLW